MSVLPLYIEIDRPRPAFEACLNHRDLLSGLVLPAILAEQRKRWNEMRNKDWPSQKNTTEAEKKRVKQQNDLTPGDKLSQQVKEERASLVRSDADKFQVSLDVQQFSPEEISVKTADGCIVVEGRHEEKQDEYGYISRRFVRRYALPEGCHSDTVRSRLSSDGVLTVTAPKKQPELVAERVVPILHAGPSRDPPATSQQQQEGVQQ